MSVIGLVPLHGIELTRPRLELAVSSHVDSTNKEAIVQRAFTQCTARKKDGLTRNIEFLAARSTFASLHARVNKSRVISDE